MKWLADRFRSLIGTYQPYERRVLLNLAALRATITAGFSILMLWVQIHQEWAPWAMLITLPANATLAALASADFVEPILRKLLLGYSYNPYVSAIGELEGYNGPTDAKDLLAIMTWDNMKCGPPPGGNANPLLPWWGNPASGSFCP